MSDKGLRIIISGGGSGGHVFPAIAIANALKEIEPDALILFVGAKGKIEMEKVPKAGYPIKGLWISGFHRKLTLRNLLFPFKLLHSLIKAGTIIRQFKPDIVVGVGGFASGPVLEMASRMGIPSLIQEQNSYAGLTNKLLAKKVNRVCVAYSNMDRFFEKEKIVLTGNPVRKDLNIAADQRAEALNHFDLDPDKQTIFVFGGSLGAKSMNQAMAANTAQIAAREDIQIFWQCGKLYWEDYKDCATAQLPNVKITTFVDRMDLAYVMADLVICRAGALTISELCLVGKPALLIPSPNVAEDHQTQNAMALVKEEAAVMLEDKQAKEEIMSKAFEILEDKQLSERLATKIKQLAKVNAANEIAQEVLKLTPKSGN